MNYTYRLARRLARLRHAAFPAACGLGSADRSIRQHHAPRYHPVSKALPVLTLVLLLAACTESSAPLAPAAGSTDEIDMSLLRRGWGRKLVRIQIAPDTARVSPGQTTRFMASGVFSDGKSRLITVSWATTGGTIDSTGLFRAEGTAGFYQVIGTERFAGLTDTAAVIEAPASDAPAPEPPAPEPPAPVDTTPPVDEPPPPADEPPPAVSSVSVTPSSATLAMGRSVQLTATAKDANGTVITALPVSWSGANSAIASVSSSGMVQAVRAGSTTITALVEGVEGKANITVNEPPPTVSSVSITPASAAVQVGDKVQLTATAKEATGGTLSGIGFSWASSNPSVAPVSSTGVVTGLAAGSATVTVTAQGVSATAAVAVSSPTPSPVPPGPTSCTDEPHTRVVNVSTFSQLNSAASNALPGDLIVLADGRYDGRLSLGDHSGTATAPITICGTHQAVVGPSVYNSTANAILIMRAPYWQLVGFRVTGSSTGIAFVQSPHFEIRGMEVDHVNTGIHPYGFSHHGLIQGNYVHDTGIADPERGEAIYVGTTYAGWCTYSSCGPDRTDSVRVLNNRLGPGVPSELLDAKEGTTGGVFDGNTLDGSDMIMSQVWVDAWVEVKGNGWKITNNTGAHSLRDGYQVENSVAGWSSGNLFSGNTASVEAPGYGFMIRVNQSSNIVECGQTVRNAGNGFSNVACR